MSFNSFGRVFTFTTWGESHGPALGATVDGCPPGVALDEGFIQRFLDRRRPGTSKFTTQRQEPDQVRILSGTFEGRTTGTPIQLMIENTDQRSKDYGEIAEAFRPGHADIAYHLKYGIRDYRGGGRSSARETAARVAAGGVAQAVLRDLVEAHVLATDSKWARGLLDDWDRAAGRFQQVVPKEMLARLEHPLDDAPEAVAAE